MHHHLLHVLVFPPLGTLPLIIWFGIMETGIALTSVIGLEIARRCVNTTRQRPVAWALFIAICRVATTEVSL